MFFFFKQKTAYEMRISDWSSDVCSSDLQLVDFAAILEAEAAQYPSRKFRIQRERDKFRPPPFNVKLGEDAAQRFSDRNYAKSLRILRGGYKIGRASCRERGCQ